MPRLRGKRSNCGEDGGKRCRYTGGGTQGGMGGVVMCLITRIVRECFRPGPSPPVRPSILFGNGVDRPVPIELLNSLVKFHDNSGMSSRRWRAAALQRGILQAGRTDPREIGRRLRPAPAADSVAAITRASTLIVFEPPRRLEFTFLKHAQRFRLQFERQFTDFVEEYGRPVSNLEAASLACQCPGKRAFSRGRKAPTQSRPPEARHNLP